ncbi:mucin-associated surface protein [Trypanosoma cruzi cruzi]|uniref:Mucin-associated surface protein (MASP) n=1 Tax=Trypanosoma cruzi TaxID=5693 RepID=A0A2V2V8L9_TRYCR|nr:mucin-associated surface protein [Trypanosoma cruzi cruzi]PWU92601.1 Mucin-associated surface protein (MASP) [Trypanosoma cruzi]
MAMMMTGRELLVCALCVLWCGAGGVYAGNLENNAVGGCMASGVLNKNKSYTPSGCEKTALTLPLRSTLPVTAAKASDDAEDLSPEDSQDSDSGVDTGRAGGADEGESNRQASGGKAGGGSKGVGVAESSESSVGGLSANRPGDGVVDSLVSAAPAAALASPIPKVIASSNNRRGVPSNQKMDSSEAGKQSEATAGAGPEAPNTKPPVNLEIKADEHSSPAQDTKKETGSTDLGKSEEKSGESAKGTQSSSSSSSATRILPQSPQSPAVAGGKGLPAPAVHSPTPQAQTMPPVSEEKETPPSAPEEENYLGKEKDVEEEKEQQQKKKEQQQEVKQNEEHQAQLSQQQQEQKRQELQQEKQEEKVIQQHHQQEQHKNESSAENEENHTTNKTVTGTNTTANTDDTDSSTAVSHTTSPLLLLLVVACAAAAAVVAA